MTLVDYDKLKIAIVEAMHEHYTTPEIRTAVSIILSKIIGLSRYEAHELQATAMVDNEHYKSAPHDIRMHVEKELADNILDTALCMNLLESTITDNEFLQSQEIRIKATILTNIMR